LDLTHTNAKLLNALMASCAIAPLKGEFPAIKYLCSFHIKSSRTAFSGTAFSGCPPTGNI